MNRIDEALSGLAGAPLPGALDGLEAMVLARVAAIGRAPMGRTRGGFAAGILMSALILGVAGGGFTANPARAAGQSMPFGLDAPLAPSTLLVGAR
ncbi:MAG: hypothetical protein H0W65_02770 [Sphingomonas sp.]|uniref:hypothetical protein n=1 Tax=Sphingomonas sp. TaxID=28214 RepID=UPI0017C792B9|nr:hypothetical protein [Sphingomonas sp.]MBA3666631.1 hypothetical protein [Sphingomonas sp.]